MNPLRTHLLTFFTGGAFTALFFFFTAEPAEPTSQLQPYIPDATEAPASSTDDIIAGEDAECRDTLLMVREAHAQAIKEHGAKQELVDHLSELVERISPETPIDFPDHLDDVFHPEGFEQALDDLKLECPELFPPETTSDCSEFPCSINFLLQRSGEVKMPWHINFDEDCPALKQHFGQTSARILTTRLDDEIHGQYIPTGTGTGHQEFLNDNHGKILQRIRNRSNQHQQQLATERFEAPCVNDHDPDACRQLSQAFWTEPEERDFYAQLGCDADDASSCNNLAWHRCATHGNCDDIAERNIHRSLDLDPENGNAIHTLGYIQCQRGQPQAAAATWQRACELGHELSCRESC